MADLNGGVVLVVGEPTGYAQQIVAGPHQLSGDEPASLGGTDTGPTPYDFLLAALGTCTSMTLRMYAARKEWPLEEIQVRLRHQRIHAKDCADCETTEGKIDLIEKDITLAGPLSVEQRTKLLDIADRCPVHRSLTSENKISSRLVD